jgi:hypothetical protein
MTYQDTITADAPYIYIPFTGNSVANQGGSKTGMTNTASGLTYGTSDTYKGACGILSGSTSFVQYTIGTDNLFNGAFTIETWIKAGTQASYANIIHREEGNSKIAFRIDAPATTNANKLVLEYRGTTGSVSKTVVGPVITDNAWHHVVVTDDRTNVTMYVDGVQVAQNISNTAAAFVSSTWRIGAYGTGSANENYAGSVDEVALWKTALTATQVANHYNAGLGKVGVTVSAPVATASLTAVNPTAAYAQKEVTISAPAMDAGIVEFNPAGIITETISQTVSLVSTSLNGAVADTITGSNPNSYNTYTFNTFTIPTGYQIISARMDFYVESSSSPATLRVQTWNAGNTARVNSGDPDASLSGTTARFIDVTKAVQAKGNVFVLSGYTGGTGSLVIDNQNAFSSKRPTLTVQMAAVPAVDKTVVAPVMTGSIAAPVPAVSNTKNPTIDVSAISANLDSVTPVVSTAGNLILSVPAMDAGLMDFAGGIAANPDAMVLAGAVTVSLTAPNATQYVSVDLTVEAPAIYFGNLENEPITVNLTTNRLTVAPAMSMTLRWPGIYSEAADRYNTLIKNAIKNPVILNRYSSGSKKNDQQYTNSVWYKVGNEAPGATRLTDASPAVRGTTGGFNGYVFGEPEFGVPGPQLRKAARFDGVDDYIAAGPYTGTGLYDYSQGLDQDGMYLTVEFSVRTSQLNGCLFRGGGGVDGKAYAFDARGPAPIPNPDTVNKVLLRNGYIWVQSDWGTFKAKTGFISDGEWHHIMLSFWSNDGDKFATTGEQGYYDKSKPFYVHVDGSAVITRFTPGSDGYSFMPYSFMADADVETTPAGTDAWSPIRGNRVKDYIAGDLADVIIRIDQYIERPDAQNDYYEWSDSAIVKATPMTVDLTAVPPFKARGNTKRMLALYGLPAGYSGWQSMRTGPMPLYQYAGSMSGFILQSMDAHGVREFSMSGWDLHFQNSGFVAPEWQKTTVFQVEGYAVYAVNIRKADTLAADGIYGADAVEQYQAMFIDESTGLPRFIDLQEDLAEDVKNFDMITVTNYPWFGPNGYDVPQTGNNNPGTNPELAPEFGLFQHDMGMSLSEWGHARDMLRDSILQAAYDGVNLWIGEWHMAQHLGFIGDVDFHSAGQEHISRLSFDYDNYAAKKIDDAHFVGGRGDNELTAQHGYYLWPHRNTYRRIVAEVPDLTDLPSNEFGERLEGWSANDFEPNGSFLCHDIVKRPNGLQVGDKVWMDVLFKLGSAFYGQTEGQGMTEFAPQKRYNIVSARPDGIVGRVVSREMESYYDLGRDSQGNPIVIDNPYKNNAYTIAAERGSVVRGRPIRGRAFIELMELGASTYGIAEDKNKNKWHGDNVPSPVTTWAFDTRRYKEVKLQNVTTAVTIDSENQDGGGINIKSIISYYMTYESGEYVGYTSMTMHMRGLNWLASALDTNGDDFIGYAAPITVNLTTPAPVHSNSKNPVSQVIGAMRLDLEVRQPANYSDGSVTERTLPMEISLDMRGTGASATVPPMVVSLSAVAPVIDAETETIVLYMDNTDTLTLFIKEEN